ncbi:MAG: alpha/beta hydrolase [Deltaproteobacteria bacterium]|nr:MAG: alpha/beta hydrolase [Deltaproteobacteria bacterium]
MGDTILMIHGMGCSEWVWDNYRGFFEKKGYSCITPTLRYHDMDPKGTPDPRLGTTSLLDYVTDLEKVISTLDTAPVVMGHSMGGIIAQMLSGRNTLKATVLLTPASPRGIMPITFSVLKCFSEILMTWGYWKKPIRFSFEKLVYGVFNRTPDNEHRKLYDKMVYESGRALFEMGNWLLDSAKTTEVDHEKVTCPVLVVSGKEDRITPASVAKKVANKYGAVSTYKEFPQNAHWVLGEPNWQEIAEFVSNWLNQVSHQSTQKEK